MTDIFTQEKRSEIMSRIRGRDTKPEMLLRKKLFSEGLRYRTHHREAMRADIAFPRARVAVFIDGCFWHGCPLHYRKPKTNRDYWIPKIRANIERDRETTKRLEGEGWIVIRLWEHEIKDDIDGCAGRILAAL